MLTESQYKELVRYRLGDVPDDEVSTETKQFLCRKKYIIKYHPMMPDGSYSKTVMCAITDFGQNALAKYERAKDIMRKEKADKEADKASDRKFQTKQTILDAVVGTVLALAIEHFGEIISFVASLFHK